MVHLEGAEAAVGAVVASVWLETFAPAGREHRLGFLVFGF